MELLNNSVTTQNKTHRNVAYVEFDGGEVKVCLGRLQSQSSAECSGQCAVLKWLVVFLVVWEHFLKLGR